MKLVAGLGNPGAEYKGTRHNVGFEFVEKMAEGEKFSFDRKLEAEVCKAGRVVFVKPQTFMNDSGRAVRKVSDFYKISRSAVILVHDDLDLKLGDYKIQMGVGPKVHNGVSSVEECLGGKDFWRVRLGIDNRDKNDQSVNGADYVLAKFRPEELETVEEMIEEAVEDLLVILGL